MPPRVGSARGSRPEMEPGRGPGAGTVSVMSAPASAPGDLAEIPVVLLDLDGTIVDSGPGILGALAEAFAECGEPLPPQSVLRTFLGPPLEDSFRDTLGLSEHRSEQLRRVYVERYRAAGIHTATPYPGVTDLVEALTAAGRTVAVATNKLETTARRLLEHQGLADRFALIGGTDRTVGRTDKTAVIGSVLERLDVPAAGAASEGPGTGAGTDAAADVAPTARAVMVGDRLHDAEGAAAHGLPAVLVGWGYGGAPERAAALPFAESVDELAGMLLR